ncbi:potassium channel family protein [Thomasclavelia saccharogumia]|uniref:potassium channel family protein n=1 Tax=Thomasclavelia saccharogumia TaxID=341225 RepID=UPI000478D6F4|nr:TrkA family potassium uptake protein [Thomasclavelia saccharogumia]
MKSKQYAVLGLGVFGSTVATTLAQYNCEVIAIDIDESCVERIADEVTKAVVADTTDIEQLRALGLDDIDVAIIAIGTHLEESVLTTMNVKDLGVPYVIAKAKNKQFSKILEKVGADRVIRAEKDMGIKVAKSLLRKNIVDLVELDKDYSFVEINAPVEWIGKSVQDLDIRKAFHMNVIGVKDSTDNMTLNIGANYIVKNGDRFLVIGKTVELERFDYFIK